MDAHDLKHFGVELHLPLAIYLVSLVNFQRPAWTTKLRMTVIDSHRFIIPNLCLASKSSFPEVVGDFGASQSYLRGSRVVRKSKIGSKYVVKRFIYSAGVYMKRLLPSLNQ